MSENIFLQAQQNFFKALTEDHFARVEAVSDEVAKIQNKAFAQWQTATAEAIKLWTGSFEYGVQLSAEYRKLALEAARQAASYGTTAAKA
jgi:cytoplasmic iron level regulating protein YaaA (DUF328/UPF0246 family)